MSGLVIAAILGMSVANVGWDDLTLLQRHDATAILIENYGNKYELSNSKKVEMLQTIECETGGSYLTGIKSSFPGEKSWGLAQINIPSNPGVTKTMAVDPDFSVDFMAKSFSVGLERHWTCWRNSFT